MTWRSAVPELAIAAIGVAAVAAAGYALGGPAVMAVVVIVAVVAGCGVLRGLVPPAAAAPSVSTPDPGPSAGSSLAASNDYWRKRARVTDGIESMGAYDAGLRRILEHLLASRLAERHGISLYDDPEAARRVLCPDGRGEDLWAWIDPAGQPPEPTAPAPAPAQTAAGPPRPARRAGQRDTPGIPRRTLTRLIDRLEHL